MRVCACVQCECERRTDILYSEVARGLWEKEVFQNEGNVEI